MIAAILAVAGTISLNGLWDFRLEAGKPMEEVAGLPAFAANDKMIVPGAWDAMSHYYNRRGTGCYRRKFDVGGDRTSARLVVDGMGLRARFWLDGRDLGLVKLPWSRFEIELGSLKDGEHEIVAAVDSIADDGRTKLFHDYYDFYPFGGFHHGVWIESTWKPAEFKRVVVRTRDYRTGEVELQVEPVAGLETPMEGLLLVSFDNGEARPLEYRDGRVRTKVPNFKLWTPETPNLHTVTVTSTVRDGNDRVTAVLEASARFGIRQVGTEKGRITLNGRPVYLKGVNRHEAHYEFGCTTSRQLMYEDIRNVKDLGGNFIRGSHYAQCEEFLDLCDELGVLVWEESLGWGNLPKHLKDKEFCDLQIEQTRLMVRNSINHPSVIISAFLNEPDSRVEECRALVDRLVDAIRAEDSGHLVTFACTCNLDDIAHVKTDIIAYNTYPGWYVWMPKDGSAEEMRRNIRGCHEEIVKYFRGKYRDERPIIVSETGVKADYGARDPRGKAQYSEDHQEEYERMMLEELFAMKDIAGIAIWQFTDAKTYTRIEGMRGRSYGVNTGGLYDLYRRPKLVVETIRKMFTAKAAYEKAETK